MFENYFKQIVSHTQGCEDMLEKIFFKCHFELGFLKSKQNLIQDNMTKLVVRSQGIK